MTVPEAAPPMPTPETGRPWLDRPRRLAPFAGVGLALGAWWLAAATGHAGLFPGPGTVARALAVQLARGTIYKHVVASLFRVTWGYLTAIAVATPLGLWLGWSRGAGRAVGPILQILRPISPLAWIPLSILWFGLGDRGAIFIIFLAASLPFTLVTMNAVRSVPRVYLRVAQNFGLSSFALFRYVLLPAVAPRLVVGLRLSLGIAWLVVVAAEMLAVSSGLGFLIVDSRNAGNRLVLVIAGMLLIGVIGLGLDVAMRRLARLPEVRWGYRE